jgi:hypothetical protein
MSSVSGGARGWGFTTEMAYGHVVVISVAHCVRFDLICTDVEAHTGLAKTCKPSVRLKVRLRPNMFLVVHGRSRLHSNS